MMAKEFRKPISGADSQEGEPPVAPGDAPAPSGDFIRSLYEDHVSLRGEVRRLRRELENLRDADHAGGLDDVDHTEDLPRPSFIRRLGGLPRHRPVGAAIALTGVLVIASIAPRVWGYLHSYESTDDAQVDSHIDPISSRLSGTIARIYVDDNQQVKAGQLIAEIDPKDYDVAVERARAELAVAQAQVRSAEQTLVLERARLAASQATYEKARKDAARFKVLFDERVLSENEYEKYVETAGVDKAAGDAERAAIAVADKERAARQAQADAGRAALDQALLDLSYTKITAPVGGIIGKRTAEVGQRVQPGQELLAIVRTDDLWVTANFQETQLARMHIGQPATIHIDAFGHDYDGYVESLSGASGEKYSLLPPENATGNYVKVVQRLPLRIRFSRQADPEHRLRPGMSVEATVWFE